MNIILMILQATWAILCLISFIAGIIAWWHWCRQGSSIPRAIHITAVVLFAIGTATAGILFMIAIRSLVLTILLCLGFPASAYVGWLVAGPPEQNTRRHKEYDIHEALIGRRK